MSHASALEPLRAANLLSGEALFEWRHIAPSGDRVASSSGPETPTGHTVDAPPAVDLLLVIAGGRPERFDHAPTFAYLRRAARAGVRIGGVSGGPVILARAGLMEGRHMTVHWEHAAGLAEDWPDLMLSRALYVIDRDRVTCAGGAAPLDMMHALIAERHGADLAAKVADWFHHTEIRPPGGPQRAGGAERWGVRHPKLIAAFEAMEGAVAEPLSRAEIASRVGLSERQLGRLFSEKTGKTFAATYRDLRLARARDLIRQTSLPLTEIALACGFSTPSHFSAAYRAWSGAPPSRGAG
ncbi:MAG: GlxA family transcriptional regulator [Pseudomonadota bacterium]